MSDLLIRRTANISACGQYRYRLTRYWGPGCMLPFAMLNPSKADAEIDDPTIRRCMGFARREGAGGIVVVNQFGFRATSPDDLWKANDPFGPENENAIWEVAVEAKATNTPIVCAWGAHGNTSNHFIAVLLSAGARLVCLGRTKDGHPRHPLYVRDDQELEAFV